MNKARRLILRADELSNWTAANPVLIAGEIGLELDTGLFKVGDGSTDYDSLPYFVPSIPTPLPIHTVANKPNATLYTGAQIYVSDETGGAVIAFSDGTNWRRVTDRAVIS